MSATNAKAWCALVAVYIFWGTTYLAIRIALESFSPAIIMASRFLLSGAILLIVAALIKANLPRGRELWFTSLFGILGLGGGTTCLVVAEQWIPSSVAALFITTAPFWLVALESALPGGDRFHAPDLIGILVGFSGTLVLVMPAALQTGWSGAAVRGFLIIQCGQFCWCLGSLLQRRQQTKTNPIVSGAVQQFATGLISLPFALLLPNQKWIPEAGGLSAIIYLVTFGSIVGYSAYLYALKKLPVPIVSTYTYVNPLVAVALGSLLYREPFGKNELTALALILTGVALVKWTSSMRQPTSRTVKT